MYVRVKVVPDVKKEHLEAHSETEFTVSVKEPAERNLANRRVLELLALYFKIPKTSVRLISGHHSPRKIFSVQNEDIQ